jgi:prophage regulatory protein
MTNDPASPIVFRAPAVCVLFGLNSREQLDGLVNDGEFPKPIKIGKRAVAWLDAELKQWLEQRIAERDGRAAEGARAAEARGTATTPTEGLAEPAKIATERGT